MTRSVKKNAAQTSHTKKKAVVADQNDEYNFFVSRHGSDGHVTLVAKKSVKKKALEKKVLKARQSIDFFLLE